MRPFFSKIKYLDTMLAVICFLLLLVGLSLIYSTSLNGDRTTFVRQLIYVAAAILLFLFFSFIDFRALTKLSRYVYVLLLVALVAIFPLGQHIQGSTRWFNFKFFHFQPAEFIKIIVILVLARFFALRRGEINIWKNILISFLYVFV